MGEEDKRVGGNMTFVVIAVVINRRSFPEGRQTCCKSNAWCLCQVGLPSLIMIDWVANNRHLSLSVLDPGSPKI